jgi:hypothetical protein
MHQRRRGPHLTTLRARVTWTMSTSNKVRLCLVVACLTQREAADRIERRALRLPAPTDGRRPAGVTASPAHMPKIN